MNNSTSLFTKDFIILCVSSTLFMFSFGMLVPELPKVLKEMGGEDYLGFIIGVFTVSAGLSRLWSGTLADKIGRVNIMLFGSLIMAICGGLYIFTTTLFSFFLLRFIHGMSTGWRPTGSTTYVIDIVPKDRIGEAMGYLGIAGSSGMAIGPALGSYLATDFSFDLMFITSSVFGLVSLLLTFKLNESPDFVKQKLKLVDFNLFKNKILDFSTIKPSIITLFDTFAFGVIITTSPYLVTLLGFKYTGLFNLTFALTSIATRFFAGKYSDKNGREKTITIGLLFLILGLVLMILANSILTISIAAVFYGLAIGFIRPTAFAWTADLANPVRKASSMATMLLFLEIGIGSGAFISGMIYDKFNVRSSINAGLYLALFFAVLALVYIQYLIRISKKKPI